MENPVGLFDNIGGIFLAFAGDAVLTSVEILALHICGMILFSLSVEKLNSWRSWRLGGSFFIPILCNAEILS